jgi:two-component system chemotaxis response regulator CheB
MQIKVLVVDDSRFYRNRLCDILASEPDIQVIATAENGREGVEKAEKLKPDVITMDIEMPVMDGIAAVREIMKTSPIPILMFSSLTAEGAKATLDALDAGAVDFLLKRLDEMAAKHKEFAQEICNKIRAVAMRSVPLSKLSFSRYNPALRSRGVDASGTQRARPHTQEKMHLGDYKVVVIGASTGGPSAIQEIVAKLPKAFPSPVLIIQHMPAAFTGPFARRLDLICSLNIKEAEDGDVIAVGNVYIAPGGKQMVIEERAGKRVVRIRNSNANEQYKPSVDVSFQSVSNVYGKSCLAIILTGMGADGREGASYLKKSGSTVWAQDEHSCVVYGMPHAIVEAGLADRVLPITEIARQLTAGA